jgi:quercetin dioxygenase-like cupin family protein
MSVSPRVVWMPGGVHTEIHLTANDTAGAFCLLVDQPPAGWALPSHLHAKEAETIHIIKGDFEMELDGTPVQLSAGESIHIPQGVAHSGGNVGERTGKRVVIFSPAGMERFFIEAGLPTADIEPDLAAVLAAANRHGWQFLPRQ